ncbi:hypothetical protein AX774_g3721 [Zancudomyces culisetae]|uniref:Uncharacterized protein n=1 Tax=Zancudomyces culisetae TaxID=1213189 RepID=A0A1R1PPB0_ZANCU|nr:hypothetical protein AX774_g3721 [Zancudomyces culisetae]|eukprot:OMH82798.1 hypothetical protein AX774_g3721 [Zancudomyces culisetae]
MEKAKSAGNPGANSNEYILDLSLSDTTHMGHSGTIGTRGVNRNRGGIDATNRGGVASKFGRKGNFLFFWRRDKKNAPEVHQRVSAPINEPRISGFTTTQTMIRDVNFATTNSTTNNISMFLRGYSERGNIEINHFPGLNRSANESYGEENIAQFSANLSDVEIDEKYQDISRGLTFSQEEIEIMNGRI